MAKRKRDINADSGQNGSGPFSTKKSKGKQNGTSTSSPPATAVPTTVWHSDMLPTIQIVAGSYDRVLHGVTASVVSSAAPPSDASHPGGETARFADSFLFNAHTSAIRCLALSPPSAPAPGHAPKIFLATGSTDERVNLYGLSARAPRGPRPRGEEDVLSAAAPRPIRESRANRELGSLLHHGAAVTGLAFAGRAKLLSAAEDSTVAVTRTRDWALLGAVRAPAPAAQGRPAGDTGSEVRGVAAFAVHPSLKVMVSVSRGERAMRLWNLVTGKKAGVLNFGRAALAEVGEVGRGATGEGRRVVWGSGGGEGEEEFAVAFDRGMLVFGMDSKPRCKVLATVGAARIKLHAVAYVELAEGESMDASLLAVSTEDGRVLFFSTRQEDLAVDKKKDDGTSDQALPSAKLVAQLGGKEAGVSGRIKDFVVLPLDRTDAAGKMTREWYVVTGSSDGKIRVWKLSAGDLRLDSGSNKQNENGSGSQEQRQVARLLGIYETQNRITCLGAFIMIPRKDGDEDSEDELLDEEDSDGRDKSSGDE